MRFDLLGRDGLARRGVIEIDGQEYPTPTLATIGTEKLRVECKGPRLTYENISEPGGLSVSGSSFFDTDSQGDGAIRVGFRGSPYSDARTDKSGFVFLDNISSIMLDSSRFVEQIVKLKSSNSLLKPLLCSVAGFPHRLAFLAYCGVDVIDTIPLVMAARNGQYLTNHGIIDASSIKEMPCSCEACESDRRDLDHLLRHNQSAAESEIRLVRHAIDHGKLRELVESRVRCDPWLVQNLRLMDLTAYQLQEMHAPIKGAPFHAGSKESLNRPDITRWKMRIQERYHRPEGTKILVLIPCSARKPYSLSKSHKRFREAILTSGKAPIVHEVIVTSPLGIVPRELELFYPAKDYDIPVTGHWDRDEKHMVQELVSWLVSSEKYDLVISHLGDEQEPVNSSISDFVDTSGGDPGARDSLNRLQEVLRDFDVDDRGPVRRSRNLEELRSICRFQFGPAGNALCDGAAIMGRWPNVRMVRDGQQIGMLTAERGMISLTLEGGKVLADAGSYCVEIDDFKPKGNLFAVGVKKADGEIRIGDDVAIVHGKEVRAVGVARMSPVEMELAQRGEAVHIRHAA
ncbi:MAG: archaeosine synthase subunit alpha [Thermoplasmata archaeon]|nr:archaeosine synthase subunit alpha [Thermoplasmata archaeon]